MKRCPTGRLDSLCKNLPVAQQPIGTGELSEQTNASGPGYFTFSNGQLNFVTWAETMHSGKQQQASGPVS